MNTTTNTTKKQKRPYRKTGKYKSVNTNPSENFVSAINSLAALSTKERNRVIGIFN